MKLFLVCFCGGLLFLYCGTAPLYTPEPVPPGRPSLSVLTYNVNFGLGGHPEVVRAIRELNADVVLLQETTPDWQYTMDRMLGRLYPFRAFRHYGGAGGLAILSKYPAREIAYIKPRAGWFPAWLHRVETPAGSVRFLNVHLRPSIGDSGSVVSGVVTVPSVREREMHGFARFLNGREPTIVAGDFNEDRNGRAVRVLARKGLRSVLGEYRPGAVTWWWPTRFWTIRRELDHIMYSPDLKPLDARVYKRGPSDHYPVFALFTTRAGTERRKRRHRAGGD